MSANERQGAGVGHVGGRGWPSFAWGAKRPGAEGIGAVWRVG